MRIKSIILAGSCFERGFWFGCGSAWYTYPEKHGLAHAASLSVILVLGIFSTFDTPAQPFVQAWGWNAEGECNLPAGLANVVAVAAGGDKPGGWLDQFMQGAKAKGYRVDFITLHWYGGDFTTTPAVSELQGYIQAVHDRYHLPIWLTEYALTDFSGSSPRFPTQAQQAAFVTASAKMLASLSYMQRYAWFALPTSTGSGTTGLFNAGAVATTVGRAFEAAGKVTG